MLLSSNLIACTMFGHKEERKLNPVELRWASQLEGTSQLTGVREEKTYSFIITSRKSEICQRLTSNLLFIVGQGETSH